VKLRGRTEAPNRSRGCTLSFSTRGDTTERHGSLQRLLDAGGLRPSMLALPANFEVLWILLMAFRAYPPGRRVLFCLGRSERKHHGFRFTVTNWAKPPQARSEEGQECQADDCSKRAKRLNFLQRIESALCVREANPLAPKRRTRKRNPSAAYTRVWTMSSFVPQCGHSTPRFGAKRNAPPLIGQGKSDISGTESWH